MVPMFAFTWLSGGEQVRPRVTLGDLCGRVEARTTMAKRSTREAWSTSAVEFSRSLQGFGLNLLVREVGPAVTFARDVLQVHVEYWNEDFAVLSVPGHRWMLHADHTYERNPLLGAVAGDGARGAGAEFHLYERDPDAAEARARRLGYAVLAGCLNKPHGLRECYLLDPDGYCWVLSRPLTTAD
jgi:hypothetical protein